MSKSYTRVMFFSFVDELRAAGIPASMKEHLILLEALDAEVVAMRPEEFYYLARATFVKDEGLLDRFDQVFGKVFKGLESNYGTDSAQVPEEWLETTDHLPDAVFVEDTALVLDDRLKVRVRERRGRRDVAAVWAARGFPAHGMGLRSGSSHEYRIALEDGRLVGTVDEGRAFDLVHPGAVYLHQGQPYQVTRLDLTGMWVADQTQGQAAER